jgi:hypothetical protein
MFALIEGLSFGQIGGWVLHKVGFRLLAAKAVGLALDRRVDGAIRRYVFVIGETPRTHVAELPSRGVSSGGKSKLAQFLAKRRARTACHITPKTPRHRGIISAIFAKYHAVSDCSKSLFFLVG